MATTQDSVSTDTVTNSQVHPVEFPNLGDRPAATGRVPLQRFYDVNVEVSVELGRVTLPIGDLLRLNEGAVLELERSLSEPVDIVAQGVRLAHGEVVVVEDRYAVRITEIESGETTAVSAASGAESA